MLHFLRSGNNVASILTHEGNGNGDNNVNLLDLNTAKTQLFQSVGASNFKSDVGANGSINLLDLNTTKINLFAPKPACP